MRNKQTNGAPRLWRFWIVLDFLVQKLVLWRRKTNIWCFLIWILVFFTIFVSGKFLRTCSQNKFTRFDSENKWPKFWILFFLFRIHTDIESKILIVPINLNNFMFIDMFNYFSWSSDMWQNGILLLIFWL